MCPHTFHSIQLQQKHLNIVKIRLNAIEVKVINPCCWKIIMNVFYCVAVAAWPRVCVLVCVMCPFSTLFVHFLYVDSRKLFAVICYIFSGAMCADAIYRCRVSFLFMFAMVHSFREFLELSYSLLMRNMS